MWNSENKAGNLFSNHKLCSQRNNKRNFEVVTRYYFLKDGIELPVEYEFVSDGSYYGLTLVIKDGKLGFVDMNGTLVIPTIYDKKDWNINDEYCVVKKNGLYGLLKHDGTVVVDFCWANINLNQLSENLLPVKSKDGYWGFVNVSNFKLQIEPAYRIVEPFNNGYALVCDSVQFGNWGMIDKTGRLTVKLNYFGISLVGELAIGIRCGICRPCILDKKGHELAKGWESIEWRGPNTFLMKKASKQPYCGLSDYVRRKEISVIRKVVLFPEYVVFIDDGEFESGLLPYKMEFNKDPYLSAECFFSSYAKFVGGGEITVVDYSDNPIPFSANELEEIRKRAMEIVNNYEPLNKDELETLRRG